MPSPLIQNINLFLDDKPSVYALRQKAKNALLLSGFPTAKTEAWKYTNIIPLTKKNYIVDTTEHHCEHNCCHTHENENSPFINVTFCHGKLHVEEFNTPQGLQITPLPLALYENEYKQYIFNSYDLEKHPFAALNGMYLEQGICIYVDRNTSISKPIHINYNQDNCENTQINIHNLIILEKNAKIEIIETFSSNKPNEYLTNIVNEIYLKKEASLNHYKIEKENSQATHIALNAIKIQEKGNYKQYYISKDGKICRNETLINLEQQEACAEIYSAYTAKKDCLTDITTNINHLQPYTHSNQYAKAILETDSSAVFQGKIHIAPNAIKTNGQQLHKALYLDNNANLSCKPELEIYADDVKCSHGASCGEIDKEQLFYLLSRGISKKDAIKLLTDAHLNEILALIPNNTIRELFENI